MKKLIFCCLVVLMGACKDDKKDPEPEVDYAKDLVGVYETTTVEGGVSSNHKWEVTTEVKNQLSIKYTKNSKVSVPGSTLDLTQQFPLVAVKVTAQDTFEINEKVDVEQNIGGPLNVRLSGIGNKKVNSGGVPQIDITLKFSESSSGAANTEQYLEFKKK